MSRSCPHTPQEILLAMVAHHQLHTTTVWHIYYWWYCWWYWHCSVRVYSILSLHKYQHSFGYCCWPSSTPVQPVVNFPPQTFGSKKQSFNCEWYKMYLWLEYSKENDAAYCCPCHFFAVSRSGRSDVAFTCNGFHDWKHALGKNSSLQKHNKCRSHMEATVSWNAYIQMKIPTAL